MEKPQEFEIKDNVNLVFQSKGKLYQMRLLISNGLIFLKQLEEGKKHKERIIFIENPKPYKGEQKGIIKKIRTTKKKK